MTSDNSFSLDMMDTGLAQDSAPYPKWAICRVGLATFLIMLPVTLVVPVLKELVADRFAASSFWTHSFMSINLIGAIAAAPVIAVLSDRTIARSRLVIVALLLESLFFWLMSLAPSLGLMLAARACEGAVHMLALSCLMAMAGDFAPPDQRGRTMGALGACMMFGTAGGSGIGGLLWRSWPDHMLQIAAMITIGAALFVALMVSNPRRQAVRNRLVDALALLKTKRALSIPYAYTFIDRFCIGVVISSFILYLGSVHHMDPEARSRLLAMFLVPFAVLVYPAGRLVDRIGSTIPLVAGSIGFGLVFASYGFFSPNALPVVMLISGLLSALMFAPTLSLCLEISPSKQRGAAFAGFNVAGSLGFVCGPLVGGAVCHLLESSLGVEGAYKAAFIVAGLAEVSCAVLTAPYLIAWGKRECFKSPAASLSA